MAEKKSRATSRRAASTKQSSKGTTKKGGTVKTKRATKKSPAKAAPKKTTTKKTTVKKSTITTTKAAKKTTRKSATKKSPKKPSAQKTAKKKTTKEENPLLTAKRDVVSVGTDHRIGVEGESITVFSRVKTAGAVMLVARTFGLLFIFAGAAATILGLGRTFEVSGVTALTVMIEEQYLAIDQINTTLNSTGTAIDETPDVLFDHTITQAGLADLLFTVPLAQKVHVSVRSKDTGVHIDLGTAQKIDGSLWKLKWDTRTAHDGEYEVYAYVTNQYRSYEERGSKVVVVKNDVYTESETDAGEDLMEETHDAAGNPSGTETDAASTVDTALAEQNADITIKLETDIPSTLTALTKLRLTITDASSVRAVLYADSGSQTALGEAAQVSLNTWAITLDPAKLTPQSYQLRVVAKDSAGQSIAKTVGSFSIAKTEPGTTDATTPTTTKKTTDATASTSEKVAVTEPTSRTTVKPSSALAASTPVLFTVKDASFAEVYARPSQSLKDVFLGLGTKVDATTWRFLWDTTKIPNGEYELFAKHRSPLGYFFSDRAKVTVYNEPLRSTDDATKATYIDEIKTTDSTITDPVKQYFNVEKTPVSETGTDAETDEEADETITVSQSIVEPSPSSTPGIARSIIRDYEVSLTEALRAYATALRTGNEDAVRQSERRLTLLKGEIVGTGLEAEQAAEMKELTLAIDYEIDELANRVKRTEAIVKDRIGEAVVKDSDQDGITDYDEITLYKTDPFVADTDNDGFIDGAEVESGYDPTDASQEAVIKYESPQGIGV